MNKKCYADYYSIEDIEKLNSHIWQLKQPIAYCGGDFICKNCGILLMRCETVKHEEYYCLQPHVDTIDCNNEIIKQVLE